MNFKTFSLGLAATFGLPWVFAIAIPYTKMANLPAPEFTEAADGFDGVYEFARSGRTDGASIYAANGCAVCLTQLIRPTYAGSELWRKDWAGVPADPANGVADTRRETNPYDYTGEKIAQIGQSRIGPDLSNVAIRAEASAKEAGMTSKQWMLEHLYDPREIQYNSVCSSVSFMFKGAASKPKSDATALAAYLLGMRKDNAIPMSLNPSPANSTK